VADPLARDEDRHLAAKLHLAHLEGRGVPVTHQVAQQAAVVVELPGARAVADPRGLDDVLIRTHVVERLNEAEVQDRDLLTQERLGAGCERAGGDGGHGGGRVYPPRPMPL
jgi:hypothetical protein